MTKLLIVDDSSMMRKNIELNLKDMEVEIVGTAGNGKEAIAMVKDLQPDAMTLDITMPEMDGLQCLDAVMEIAPKIKVIVITALSDKLTGLQALDKGARGYLFKPANAESLRKALSKLILKKTANGDG